MRNYFISYAWSNPHGSGNASTSVECELPIFDHNRITQVANAIRDKHHARGTVIAIMYWRPFEESEEVSNG